MRMKEIADRNNVTVLNIDYIFGVVCNKTSEDKCIAVNSV